MTADPNPGCDGQAADCLAELANKSRSLPRSPGVYLFKNAEGSVLYIGKANSLRDRVGSYFVRSVDLGPRKQPMLGMIDDIETLECETEWEALLTESRLIKDIRPRFNALMTDDKTFPYLVITMRDDFPGVYITRSPADPEFKGARIFGPFTSVNALRESIQLLQRVFQFRTCTLTIKADDPKNRYFRPCILHPIHQCTAPCGARISKEEYRKDIDRFIRFLTSKRSIMLRELKAEMEQASELLHFEEAAHLRDQIVALRKLDDRARKTRDDDREWQPEVTIFATDPSAALRSLQRTLGIDQPIRAMEAIDIAHLQGGETVGSKVAFIDGRPFKDGYRRYRIRTAQNDDYAAIREVVSRRYREAGEGHELYPDVIVIDGGLGQLHAAMEAFRHMGVKPPMVISLAKKEEIIYMQERSAPIKLGRENPGLRLVQAMRDEAHRFAQLYHHILRRKKVLEED